MPAYTSGMTAPTKDTSCAWEGRGAALGTGAYRMCGMHPCYGSTASLQQPAGSLQPSPEARLRLTVSAWKSLNCATQRGAGGTEQGEAPSQSAASLCLQQGPPDRFCSPNRNPGVRLGAQNHLCNPKTDQTPRRAPGTVISLHLRNTASKARWCTHDCRTPPLRHTVQHQHAMVRCDLATREQGRGEGWAWEHPAVRRRGIMDKAGARRSPSPSAARTVGAVAGVNDVHEGGSAHDRIDERAAHHCAARRGRGASCGGLGAAAAAAPAPPCLPSRCIP